VNKHNLQMKLIDVEYTFDNSKIIFYFTADGRVDFRELVKDLAGVFKMRIELRQIGVRDEAKMVGGIGTCGKGLCCHTWLPEFEPVSIKMAKVQNLSLNPTKISGICGRLMCCLKYENDIYYELRRGMPEVGERIKTEDGIGVVMESNILENKIKVRLVLEEKTPDKPEKLSTDFYFYKKQQITRLDAKAESKDVLDDIDEALTSVRYMPISR
jgi:cell fate regulator YaaT (PSP1 superfamily)